MICYKLSNKPIIYKDAISFMEQRVNEINTNQNSELIWILEHPHVYTMGTSSNNDDLINTKNIPVISTLRGGKTTYHGPGQKIIYIMLDLKKRNKSIHIFRKQLERVLINTLNYFNLVVETRNNRVGLWIPSKSNKNHEKKLVAIGVRIRRWVTFHGLALNVFTNLAYFQGIIPCGLKNHGVTSMVEEGIIVNDKELNNTLINNFQNIF